MLLKISSVLDASVLDNIVEMLGKVNYIDGKATAGDAAKRVKHNEESQLSAKQAQYLDQLVISILAENPDFRNAALLHQVSQPVFARYTKGMSYGEHIDDPVMGGVGGRFRTDVAVTVFLSEPHSYSGGELVINITFGEQQIKLSAGDIVMYPASSLHRVNEVSDGERLVAVCWLQSMVRDPAQREILYELGKARDNMLATAADGPDTKRVDHAYVNLVRMWSEV